MSQLTISEVLDNLTPNDFTVDFLDVSLKPIENMYKLSLFKLWDQNIFGLTEDMLSLALDLPLDNKSKVIKAAYLLHDKIREFIRFLIEIRRQQRQLNSIANDVIEPDEAISTYFDFLHNLKVLKDKWSEIRFIHNKIIESNIPEVDPKDITSVIQADLEQAKKIKEFGAFKV